MKAFFQKYASLILTYFFGGLSAYGIYFLIHKLSLQKNVETTFSSFFDYTVIVKDNSPIKVGNIFWGLILLLVGWFLAKSTSKKIAGRILPRFHLDVGAISAVENLTFYLLFLVFSLLALHVANVPLTMFTVLGGSLALAFALGSQTLLNNFVSGIILQIERPIKVGDILEIDGTKGTVENIGARRTTIRSSNGVTHIYPNSQFLEKKVSNYTFESTKSRSDIKIIVPVGADIDRLESIVKESLNKYEDILKTPAPSLLLSEYLEATASVSFTLSYWVDLRQYSCSKVEIESNVRKDIYKEFFPKKS